jgi:hypothetical protein
MANGFAQLGAALTGGGALPAEIAEAQGQQLGANTQNAVAEAQLRQQKLKAREQFANVAPDLAAATQDPTKLGAVLAAAAQGDINVEQLGQAVHTNQTNNSYNQIVNPETADEAVARHLVAQGKPGLIQEHAQGDFTNSLHPDQGVQTTALGQSLAQSTIDLKKAQTGYYSSGADLKDRTTPPAVGPGGIKIPSGYGIARSEDGTQKLDDSGNPVLVPLTGGKNDINSPQPMGAVAARYFQNSMNGGLQGATALANVMRQPSTSTAGLFSDLKAGHTPVQALTRNALTAVTPEEDQNLNTIMSGLEQNLAVVDNSGRAPNQTYVDAMSRIKLMPGNTVGARFLKLAEARQVLENGLQAWEDSASLSNLQKAAIQRNLSTLQQAIPFTVADVQTALGQQHPAPTISDRVKSFFSGTPSGAGAPGATGVPAPVGAPASGPPPAALAQLQEGHVTTFGNGQKWTMQGGQPVQVQ